MNCSKCNGILPDGTAFCPKCGAALSTPAPVYGENTQKLSFMQKLFQRRLARKDFWLLFIIQILFFGVVGGAVSSILLFLVQNFTLLIIFECLEYLFIFLLNIHLSIGRLHDTDRSGWNICWEFLPFIGWLIVLIMECLPGTEGANRFGEPPQRIF